MFPDKCLQGAGSSMKALLLELASNSELLLVGQIGVKGRDLSPN